MANRAQEEVSALNRERTFDLESVIAEAERRESRPADKSQIRDMAERMAAERKERLRRSAALVRRTAPIAVELLASAPVAMPKPHVVPRPILRRKHARPAAIKALGKFKASPFRNSIQLLRALEAQTAPIDLTGLHGLLPGIGIASIAAYMSSFVGRDWAVRSGSCRAYAYLIGPKGTQYLKNFYPSD